MMMADAPGCLMSIDTYAPVPCHLQLLAARRQMQNSLELGRTICFSIHPVDDYQHWRSCFETYIAVYDGPNRGTMTLKDGSPVVLRGLDVHGAPMQQVLLGKIQLA